jgi:hypothetical protein
MKQITTLGLSLALTIGLAAAASAQTTSSSAGNLTTATPTTSSTSTTSTTVKRKPPTSATADMVNEAIQRSQARAAKQLETGRAQQWGSEEPFSYNPAVKKFDATRQ